MLERKQIGSQVYAIYEISETNVELDKVSIMMINSNSNKQTGLASISFDSMNGNYGGFLFDVTGRVTLSEYLRKNLTQEEFKKFIMALVTTIEGFDEYMIDVSKVLLDIDSVYINMLDFSVDFVCIALNGFQQRNTLYDFFRDVVKHCFVDGAVTNVNYIDCVRNVLRNEIGFSLSNIKASMNGSSDFYAAPGSVQPDNTFQNVPTELNSQRVEVPREVTVISAPTPPPVPPVPEPEEKKSSGGSFWDRFKSKKEPKADKKSKKKGKEAEPSPASGGLADRFGKKNSGQPQGDPFAADPFADPFAAQQPSQPQQFAPHTQPQNVQQMPSQQQYVPEYSGTTVLNQNSSLQGGFPNSQPEPVIQQQPSFPAPYNGTTVLNQNSGMQGGFPSSEPDKSMMYQQPAQVQQPAFAGTTVLNPRAHEMAGGQQMQSQPIQPQAGFFSSGTTVLNRNSAQNELQAPVNEIGNELSQPVSNATTVLNPNSGYNMGSSAQNRQCYLIRLKMNKRVLLNKPVIHIGRDLPELEFNLFDNTNVGHRHANIVQRGNGYCVIDLESKNHTYINGTMLEGGKEYPLSDGDKLRFADEEFEFMIM